MGNIECKCLKEIQQNEIITKNKTKEEEEYNQRYYQNYPKNNNNILSTQIKNSEENPTKAKAKNNKNNNNENENDNQNSQQKNSNDNLTFMDYAMDFFDEVNKYRCNTDLFKNLKEKFSSNF